ASGPRFPATPRRFKCSLTAFSTGRKRRCGWRGTSVVNKIVTLRVGNKYGEEYVENLFNALDRNTTVPFKFECIRESEFPGWWGKINLFPPKERIVFLDLDTIIVDNCDFLFQYNGPFCILRDFYRKDGYGSAVMSIAPGFGAEISRTFLADPED